MVTIIILISLFLLIGIATAARSVNEKTKKQELAQEKQRDVYIENYSFHPAVREKFKKKHDLAPV